MPTVNERIAFDEAVDFFLAMLREVRADQWTAPGLGEWTVRDLAGHASRGMSTIEAYLARPASTSAIDSPAGYFLTVRSGYATPAAVAQRGREAAAALGDDPAGASRAIATRVRGLLATVDDSVLLSTIVGGMRLIDFLPTRTFELTVHTLDLAAAIGVSAELPPRAGASALAIAGRLALFSGAGGDVLLTLTGRRSLPAGFTVL